MGIKMIMVDAAAAPACYDGSPPETAPTRLEHPGFSDDGSKGPVAWPVVLAALAVTACGGGGGTAPPPPPPPPPGPVLPSRAQAARFLNQATMGPSKATIEQVAALGFETWLDRQFAMPRTNSHWATLEAMGYRAPFSRDGQHGFDPVMWRRLIESEDQLRQRVGMALLDFLVVGIDGVSVDWPQFAVAAYVDLLLDHAFGNFRTLLEAISRNLAMGHYLTFFENQKAEPSLGTVPDENYARELMQLFTLGLYKLNLDGTRQLVNGQPVETYGQEDITGLARVFTGWVAASYDLNTPDPVRLPMVSFVGMHETGAKTFLGTTIPAGTDGLASLRLALDAIFANPNVAPFVCRQLIQRLVTSNPTPGYVQRIAQVFENNGSGTRGDLKAVVRAILLDAEARTDANAANPHYGKLREPVLRFTGWARAFGCTSPSGTWPIANLSSTSQGIGQSPGRSPSVFNFFRPGYTPPNSAIANAGLVAPEFQIVNEPATVSYVNFMWPLVSLVTFDFRPDYSALTALADNGAALVDEVDILLGAGLSAATKASITDAANSIFIATGEDRFRRVHLAVLLTLAAPEYLVQK